MTAFGLALLLVSALRAEPSVPQILAQSSGNAIFQDAELYYTCRALAQDRPSECAPLKAFKIRAVYHHADRLPPNRPETYEFPCLSDLYELQMSRANVLGRQEEMTQACLLHEKVGHDFKPGRGAAACALMARLGRDPEAACKALTPYFISPVTASFCLKEMRYMSADAGLCPSLGPEPAAREMCEAVAAFKKAQAPDGDAACAGSALCRALRGDGPEVCEGYAAAVRRRGER